MTLPADPMRWFAETLSLTGVAHTNPESQGEFRGKRLGLINGSAWIIPWANYFGRLFVPGAHLINVGNEALQVNFMEIHERGLPVPPQSNIDAFVRYARDLVELGHVDAILITCSTMNRSFPAVMDAMKPYNIPVIQIDRPIMENAVRHGGKTLVIATHGPTVASTQALLRETAAELKTSIDFSGETVEAAWHRLAEGNVQEHNELLAQAIRAHQQTEKIDSVVLAQLSMTVFLLSYPEPLKEFGVPVFTSGQSGFERVAEVLKK
jgi:aspartate/glutamate racemase